MGQQRVLYIAQTARGGSASVLYHLVKGLDKHRYEPVVLFSSGHFYFVDKLLEAGIKPIILEKERPQESAPVSTKAVKPRNIGARLETYFGRWARQAYVLLKAGYEFIQGEVPKIWPIVRAIRENKIDLVHVNSGINHGKPGIIAAWITGVPCICHPHRFPTFNYFDKIFIRFVNFYIYISQAVAEAYVAQGIPKAKGAIVHNAVDLNWLSLADEGALVRREFGWSSTDRLVGVFGRLDWWKGQDYFLKAMAQVCQQIPNLKGLIVGEPESSSQNQEYFQKLQSLIVSLGLADRIILTGFRDDVPRLMSAMDVVVHSSSRPEPFGLVIIEGMALGKSVVATAAGGVLDIIEDGITGLLVPCEDSGAMAEAILALLTHQEWAKQMGLAARRHVKEKFTMPNYIARVQEIYDSILEISKDNLSESPVVDNNKTALKALPDPELGSYQ